MIEGKHLTKLLIAMSPRIFSAISTLCLLFVLAHHLPEDQFGILQITFSIVMLVVWFCDFGYLNFMISEKKRLSQFAFQQMWFNRMFRIFFCSAIIASLIQFFFGESLIAILFLACVLDWATDSLVVLREMLFTNLVRMALQVGKKLSQLFFLTVYVYSGDDLNLIAVAAIVGLPSFIILIIDYILVGKPLTVPRLTVTPNAIKIWAQSGGTLLAGLDLWLIGLLGDMEVVFYLAIARRIATTIGIIGATTTTETLYQVGGDARINPSTWFQVLRATLLSFSVAICLISTMSYWLPLFTGRDPLKPSFILVGVIVASIPLGVLTSNLNSMLIGLQRYRQASYSTFFSSITYLLLLFLLMNVITTEYAIGVSIVVNLLFELILQMFFIGPIKKSSRKKLPARTKND